MTLTSDEPKKKAKKGAKKKAVAEATEAIVAPGGEDVLADVHETLNRVATEGYEAGVPVLLGGVTVSLHLEFDDASTPVDAVNQALMQLALNGTRSYTFLVRDEVTQVLYAVQDGRMVSLEEAREEQEPYDPHGGEKHRFYEEN